MEADLAEIGSMEKGEKLADSLLLLRRDLELSLASANRMLADGLLPMVGSPLSASEVSVMTCDLRWRWQDQLAKVMRRYVRQLWRLGKRHQIPSVSTWIGTELQTFRRVLERQLDVEFGEEPTMLAARGPARLPEGDPVIQPENGEPARLATRLPWPPEPEPITQAESREESVRLAARRPRPQRLRGELIIFRGEAQLRIPVVVSAQVRFLESLVLRPVERKLIQSASPARRSSVLHRNSPWLFQKHRNGWSVGPRNQRVEFRDLLGMTYLQTLLRNPSVEVPVEQLVQAARTTTALPVHDPEFDGLESGEAEFEILDDQARREYQQRIVQLKRDAEIATEINAAQRMAEITKELVYLRSELKSAAAIRGRPRRFAASGDRLRVSVRKSTAKAIDMISQRMPDIGEHLKASISFGFKCCYRPVQQREWRF